MSNVFRLPALVLLLPLATACGSAEPPAAGPRPSIVFISLDTLAARSTSLHGYARRTTPNLEALAREALVFERCLANAPFTTPSYISQFTGLSPASSDIDVAQFLKETGRTPESFERWNLPEARETLAETLRAAGYATAAFVDNPMCGAAFGLDQGFEHFDDSAAKIEAHVPDGGLAVQIPAVMAWLDARDETRPFFLFVNSLDVHEPYLPPAGVRGRFQGDELARAGRVQPVGRSGRFGAIPEKVARLVVQEGEVPERMDSAPLTALYDEEVLAVDALLGELFAGLRARGVWDEVVLVVSADHGEAMDGPEYKYGHGTQVEAVLHVPLVVRLPGGARGGTRLAQAVQLVDLHPTLLDFAGLAERSGPGRSLRSLLEGGTLPEVPIVHQAGRLHARAVSEGRWRLVVTHPGHDANGILSSVRGRAWLEEHHPDLAPLMTSRQSLVEMARQEPRVKKVMVEAYTELKGPYFELYDIEKDPDQLVDRAHEEPELVARLRTVYEAEEANAARERALVPAGITSGAPADHAELEALGYAGEDE
jgi:arylsulfatase